MNSFRLNHRSASSPARVSGALRFVALLLAALPLVLLATASRLRPDRDGLGTHQQLGLPPCSMRMVVGIRCPACGMTTSWAYFSRARVVDSLSVNSGGFLLALYSLAFAWVAIFTALSGRLPSVAVQRGLAVALLAVVAVTLADWGVRLMP